jgi:murein DD-endopeptidase MepM/ murein hydrolase activator NlpD
MNIIIFRDKRRQSWTLRIPRAALVAAASVVAVVVAISGFYIGRLMEGEVVDAQVVATWRDQLATQHEQIDDLKAQSKLEAAAVGRRLAQMQARVLRIEALGERVTEVAKIDSSEFSFGQPAAVGGPASTEAGFPDFNWNLDQLAAALKSKERELDVLESVLVGQRYHDEVAVRGRPVTWGWISSAYGQRVDPLTGQVGWHSGVDFAGREGSDVVARMRPREDARHER